MLDLFASPPQFDWNASSVQPWDRFETLVRLMLDGPLNRKSQKIQCAYLLLWIGEKGRDIYGTWILDAVTEQNKFDVYLQKFKDHITPTTNTVFERYKFFNRSQQPAESMEKYITNLRMIARN